MRVQIDDCQDARLGLEPQHTLVVSLILPGRTVYHRGSFVVADVVPMHVTSHEDIRDSRDNHSILWLRRKRGLPTP